MENFQVSCDGIGDDQKFLPDHTGRGEDLSPGFHLSSLPQGTETLAIVLRDESHPLFGSMTHWLIWDLPASCDIGMNIMKKANPGRGGARQGIAMDGIGIVDLNHRRGQPIGMYSLCTRCQKSSVWAG